jgi:hypothetical protein
VSDELYECDGSPCLFVKALNQHLLDPRDFRNRGQTVPDDGMTSNLEKWLFGLVVTMTAVKRSHLWDIEGQWPESSSSRGSSDLGSAILVCCKSQH